MSRITVRIDDLINQLNELKRDGAEKVLLEIEEGVAVLLLITITAK